MKICIIGPSFPFKGGIAHYMTLLYKELKEHHVVRFYSFKRQYPAWLYPGQTDKDTSKSVIADEGIEPRLDSMNPISWFEVFFKIREFAPDIVILPWWVAFWAPQFGTLTRLIKTFTKTKILLICHNVVEHEASFLTRALTKFVLEKGDFFVVHSEDDLKNLKAILPDAKVSKSHHPTYEVFKQNGWDKDRARKELNITGNTILFFGFVRPYKGLTYLIDALPKILEHLEINLLVVGEFWKDKGRYLEQINKLGLRNRIKIIDKYIPNEEVNKYFAASDVVVLPYTSATGSGIVQTALGCERPVITTRVGSLNDVIKNGKTGYLVEPKDSKSLADAVVNFYSSDREKEFVESIKKDCDEFSWKKMRQKIEVLVNE